MRYSGLYIKPGSSKGGPSFFKAGMSSCSIAGAYPRHSEGRYTEEFPADAAKVCSTLVMYLPRLWRLSLKIWNRGRPKRALQSISR